MPNCGIAFARVQPKLAVAATAAATAADWRIDPDQRGSGPNASKMQQGNGPDAVPIPPFRETSMSARGDTTGRVRRKRMEIFAFLFLTAVVMPVLAVGTVGSYGLAVWIYQMFAGPPGPPPSLH
jgi:nitrate reductase NapE